MKWVPDSTGRFQWRPSYDQEELDTECERIVTSFLRDRYGRILYPLSNDDLCIMIEQNTSILDLYADLSAEGQDVDGMTEFFVNKKPAVKIARDLSLVPGRNGRLRTTLAHEYGHVRFHSFLWADNAPSGASENILEKIPRQRRRYSQFRKSLPSRDTNEQRCAVLYYRQPARALNPAGTLRSFERDMLDAPLSDWMEWQASYAAGAILIPVSALRNVFVETRLNSNECRYVSANSQQACELISRVSVLFDVPCSAAKVRLEKLGFLQNTNVSPAVSCS